jgi:hypothetical protein
MNERSLLERLRNFEDGLTERKRAIHSNDEIRKAVVSFANSVPEGQTAVLFVGVNDDGTISGVPSVEVDKTQQRVRRICERDCFPSVAIHLIRALDIDGKQVVAFEFGPSRDRPHFAGHAYIRVGSESVKDSSSKLDELIASKNTTAGRLIAAKNKHEHVTLVISAGSLIPGQPHPFVHRREWECTVASCDAQVARFYDIAKQQFWSLPVAFLVFGQDPNWPRLLVEYARSSKQ